MEKRNWCGTQGWLILAFAWVHLQQRPESVACEIQRALAGRSLALGA
jgi:hypothetical protein